MHTIISFRLVTGLLLGAMILSGCGRKKPSRELRASSPDDMIMVRGGEFLMGASDPVETSLCGWADPITDAVPVHRVRLKSFWMDRDEVTNTQFAAFVAATGYVTVAERPLRREEFPDVPATMLIPGALVFTPTVASVPLDDPSRWWRYQPGADWRHPTGAGSSIVGQGMYPVVQVAYPDAVAYAKWASKRLPTEAEWEFAARGGLAGKRYAWGDGELHSSGRWMANVFQGKFPVKDAGEDGFAGLAPVGQFPPNGYGLRDMAGNVWEWCADWYRADYYAQLATEEMVSDNPQGPPDSFDPLEPTVAKRVQRGGSFLCSDQYCTRYLVGSRGRGEPSTGSNHVGFRCVKEAE